MKRLTLEEIQNMPTLDQGHFDNLIYRDETIKIWLSRMTVEDGMPYNNQVTVEEYQDGNWVTIDEYNPARVK